MKCPLCKYEHSWDVKGEKGDFYTLTNDIQAERGTGRHWEEDIEQVYACPKCGINFIDVLRED